jgi:hypothetical protein
MSEACRPSPAEPQVRIATSAAEVSAENWARLAAPGHPFLSRDFLHIVERTGVAGPEAGWQALHLVAEIDAEVAGLLPLYLKTHAYGDFTGDWGWSGLWESRGRKYFPRLLSGLPHTPVSGPRLLVAGDCPDPSAVRRTLIAAACQLAADKDFSSWHVALAEDQDIASLEAAGLLVSHDVQFHWHDAGYGDFDGYLRAFSAEKRRKVRAERRRAAESGLQIRIRHGDEIAPDEWPALHAIYRSTFDRFGNYPAFSAGCFEELAAALGRRMVVFTADDGKTPVALSLCFRDQTTLFGRYWGSLRQVDSLHFELCFYQGISYCLREGLTRFEPGAGGEHKIARGFAPQVVRSAHWIADPALRAIVAAHLARQQHGVDAYRDDAATHLPYRRSAATA